MQHTPARNEILLALLLLLSATLIFGFSVLSVEPAGTAAYNLAPNPDAPEYLDGAISIWREGSHHIHLGDQEYPSRYPPGFSLLVAPFLALSSPAVRAPFLANQVLAGILLLVLTLGLWKAARPAAAGLACLLVATQPGFILLARSPMSEVASGAVLLASCLLLLRGLESSGPASTLGGSLLLGLSCGIRTSHLFLVPLLATTLLYLGKRRPFRIPDIAWVAGAFLLGLAPVLVHNWLWFKNPFGSGYEYWLGASPGFSLAQVGIVANNLWAEFTLQATRFSTADLYGTGRFIGPALIMLVGLLALASFRKPKFWVFAFPLLLFSALILSYDYGDSRQFWPAILLGAVFAGARSVQLLGQPGLNRLVKAGLLALLMCAVLDWPDRKGGAGIVDLLNGRLLERPASAYQSIRLLDQAGGTPGRLVFTDLPPPYAHAATTLAASFYPFRDQHEYGFNPAVFFMEPSGRARLAASALDQGRAVLLLSHSLPLPIATLYVELPPGTGWQILQQNERGGGLAQAVPLTAPPAAVKPVPAPAASPPADVSISWLRIAGGSRGAGRLFTELWFWSSGPGGQAWLETSDRQGRELLVEFDSGERGSIFRIDLGPRSFARRRLHSRGELQSGWARVHHSAGVHLAARLSLVDNDTGNTLFETSLPAEPAPNPVAPVPPLPVHPPPTSLSEAGRSLLVEAFGPFLERPPDAWLEGAGESILPRFIDGSDGRNRYQTRLRFQNPGQDSSLQVEFLDFRGLPLQVEFQDGDGGSSDSREFPAGEVLELLTRGAGNARSGYIRVRSPGTFLVAGSLLAHTRSAVQLWEVPLPGNDHLRRNFAFLADSTGIRETYYSLVNEAVGTGGTGRKAHLEFRLYGPNGEQLQSRAVELEPASQLEGSVQSLLGEAEERLVLVTVESDQPLATAVYGFLNSFSPGRTALVPRLYPIPVSSLGGEDLPGGAGSRR